jgi:hypothetical protein
MNQKPDETCITDVNIVVVVGTRPWACRHYHADIEAHFTSGMSFIGAGEPGKDTV